MNETIQKCCLIVNEYYKMHCCLRQWISTNPGEGLDSGKNYFEKGSGVQQFKKYTGTRLYYPSKLVKMFSLHVSMFARQNMNSTGFRTCVKELYETRYDPVSVSYAVFTGW